MICTRAWGPPLAKIISCKTEGPGLGRAAAPGCRDHHSGFPSSCQDTSQAGDPTPWHAGVLWVTPAGAVHCHRPHRPPQPCAPGSLAPRRRWDRQRPPTQPVSEQVQGPNLHTRLGRLVRRRREKQPKNKDRGIARRSRGRNPAKPIYQPDWDSLRFQGRSTCKRSDAAALQTALLLRCRLWPGGRRAETVGAPTPASWASACKEQGWATTPLLPSLQQDPAPPGRPGSPSPPCSPGSRRRGAEGSQW